MKGFSDIRGHDRTSRVLKRALGSGRVAHAYLFWGPEGVGKEMTARVVAATLLCKEAEALSRGEPCGTCSSCAKTAASDHPDLHLLAPGDKAISVEDVRNFQEALSYRAFESGRKVAIIRDAFRMSPSGANALLKTVEEPPPDTFLFVLANHRNQLLPTLVSRCQCLRFDPLTEQDVVEVLVGEGAEKGAAAKLAELSGGSPGVALAHEPGRLMEVAEEVTSARKELARMPPGDRFTLAETWAKDKDTLPLRLDCLESLLRIEARENAKDGLAMLDDLLKVRRLLGRNVNAQLALDALFLGCVGELVET